MSAKAVGTVVVQWSDPNAQRKENLITLNARTMTKASAMDVLPIVDYKTMGKVFREGDYLNILFIHAETTEAMAPEKGCASVPITIKNTRTGRYEEAEVEIAGKYSFTEDVVTGTKDTEERILYYCVPLGMKFVLGKKRAFNSRLNIDVYTDA